MKKVGKLLSDAIEQTEVLKAARANIALRKWGQVLGPTLALKCVPERFDHGTIWVAASGSAWAQELRMMKGQILKALNDEAGEGIFIDVRVGVRKIVADNPAAAVAFVATAHDSELSIQEIAAKRLKDWPDESGNP